MRTSYIITGLLSVGLLASCARKNETIEPAPRDIGGKGGKATLRITPKYFEKKVDSCVIYLTYDALVNTDKFDDTVFIPGKDGLMFDSLKKGDYFIKAKAYDYATEKVMVGSGSFRVTDTISKTYDVNIAVSPL